MAWRSRLYWSNIACGDGLVAAVGDGGVVEWSWAGLVGMVLLMGGAGWQFLSSGSGVGGGGDGVCSMLVNAGGCWAVWRHRQSSRVAWHVKPGGSGKVDCAMLVEAVSELLSKLGYFLLSDSADGGGYSR